MRQSTKSFTPVLLFCCSLLISDAQTNKLQAYFNRDQTLYKYSVPRRGKLVIQDVRYFLNTFLKMVNIKQERCKFQLEIIDLI